LIYFNVRVIPRSSKPGIAGLRDDAWLVRLKSPPVEGAANAELIDVIAAALHLPKRNVAIVSGKRSKLKRVSVAGVTSEEAAAAMQSASAAT
jgi:uncharacterized protein (TIGR00251 family)